MSALAYFIIFIIMVFGGASFVPMAVDNFKHERYFLFGINLMCFMGFIMTFAKFYFSV